MNFNNQQRATINSVDGNISVIASAGSGKTTTLTYRIKNMVENHGYDPCSILAVTFSKKAKDTILMKLTALGINDANVETFHSLALKIIISSYGPDRYKVLTAKWEKEKMIQDICVSALGLCQIENVPFNDICSFIALQKVNMIKPSGKLIYPKKLPFHREDMAKIYSLYEDAKEDKGYIEFDDFLNMADEALDAYPDILQIYKDRFQYVLVDEFQDVSMPQSLLLLKINTKNTLIVGDPLQAVYSFRGGNCKFILDFDRNYPDVKVINLNTNYRCSREIVATANKLAQALPYSKHKNYVESIANNSTHKVPELRKFIDEERENTWIAQKIHKLKEEGYGYDDIAILARTNAQLQISERALHKEKIPFDIIDGALFTELPEIKLIISYLRLALNEDDDMAFRYLYNKPNRWLSRKFLEEVEDNSRKKGVPLYESMSTIPRRDWRFKNGIDEIISIIKYIQSKQLSNVGDIIHFIRAGYPIDNFVTKGKQSEDGGYFEQIDNLDSFEKMCKKYGSVKQLIQYLDELNKEANAYKGSSVKLLTIHKSKGMEYPVVFITGCNDNLLPHYRSNDIEDECRLLYVAITRAEKELYMSYTGLYNNKRTSISPFVEGIKETLNVINKEEPNRHGTKQEGMEAVLNADQY